MIPFRLLDYRGKYFKIYRTDLRQICRVARIMAVDDQSEINCSISQGTLSWLPILLEFR